MNWGEVFRYDTETGLLYWRIKPAVRVAIGDLAGWTDNSGYQRVLFCGVRYQVHRIIWDMHNPNNPVMRSEEVDHIDHNRLNNILSNLRKVNRKENMENKKLYRNNKSGVPGVVWNKRDERWVARITTNQVQTHIGYFVDWFDAVCARKSAENKYGFHCNHGLGL